MRSTVFKVSLLLVAAVTVPSLHAVSAVAQSAPALRSPAQVEVIPSLQQRQIPQAELQQANPSSSSPQVELHLIPMGPQFPDIECPEGTHLIIWDQPIYDDEGLFIIGHEPTPYSVPDDAEPAG